MLRVSSLAGGHELWSSPVSVAYCFLWSPLVVLPWSQVVSAHVCINYCPDEYLRRTLCTCLQLRTVPASPAFLPALGCALASRCCRLTSFVSRLLGHCLSLLEVQCLETHHFINCGVIFIVSGGRGNLVPDVPFWPEVEVCCFMFTSTLLSQKTCLVFQFFSFKILCDICKTIGNKSLDLIPNLTGFLTHWFYVSIVPPVIEVRVYWKGPFINQQTKPNTVSVWYFRWWWKLQGRLYRSGDHRVMARGFSLS